MLPTATALLLLLALLLGGGRDVRADEDQVNCGDLDMTFEAGGYDLSCAVKSEMLAGFDGTVRIQRLEATASDSSRFLDARLYNLMGRVYYSGMDLRNNLDDFYGHLSIKDWHSGHAVATLATAEFATNLRGLPSKCVAFQKFGHHEYQGYKKVMIGIACSQGDIDQAYEALKRLTLPD
jgi:hypothetical protein